MFVVLDLDLSHNRFANVPDTLLHLQNLSVLNLGDNKLSTIPRQVLTMENLKIIHLQNNNISGLFREIQIIRLLLNVLSC